MLKTTLLKLIHIFLFMILFVATSCSNQQQKKESKPPNILFIISDDQAWGDYSFMGHPHIQTPRIDQLARESLTFTRGYVTAPLCSPSLASMITGLYAHQHGITGNDPLFEFDGKRYSTEWRIERDKYFSKLKQDFLSNTLLTQRLEKHNYRSLQTGKWWIGSWEDGHFDAGMTHGDFTKNGRHGDDGLVIGREGLDLIYDFMDESDSLDQPFFVWYAPFLPHAPHTPPEELEQKYLKVAPTPAIARYWAMCEWFDQTCGDLLDYLDQKQLSEETIVVYVCDNGWIQEPDRPNRFAPRSKQSPYEGGIRTPIMYRWPRKIQAKMDTSTFVSSIDIVPTLMAACGLENDPSLPGINVLDSQALQGRKTIFAEAYDHDIRSVEEPTQSLKYRIALSPPWKLILPDAENLPDSAVELFDVITDPDERANIAADNPEVVERLQNELNEWWKRKN